MLNQATSPPPTTARLPSPPRTMRREIRRWGDGFSMGGGVSSGGSRVGDSIAPGAEVRVGSACGDFKNSDNSDCDKTGVSSDPEESGSVDMNVGALECNAGSGAFPHACSRALANARRLAKRCCGSFARAMNITCSTSDEIVGTFSRKDGREANICWLAISVKDP
jgi:hypothetical protein